MSERPLYLTTSKNNKKVVYYPTTSHTATHFKDNPTLIDITIVLLESLELSGDIVNGEYDMKKHIGYSSVIKTYENDEIVYAIRQNRLDQGYVPFVKNRKPKKSSKLSVYLEKIDNSTYNLASVWIGEYESPPFPQMKNATDESIPYWKKNAFVYGSQTIINDSEISLCPW